MDEDEFLREVSQLVAGRGDSDVEFARSSTKYAVVEQLPRLVSKRSIRTDDLVQLHAALTPGIEHGLRREYVRCGGASASTAIYVPPPPLDLGGYVKDMVEYFNFTERHNWLTKSLALAVQILVVHPFRDGNGRLARAVFALAASRSIGYRWSITSAMESLWSRQCLLIHAINDTVLYGNGWRDSALEILIDSVRPKSDGLVQEKQHAQE